MKQAASDWGSGGAAGSDRKRFDLLHADALKFYPELMAELGAAPASLLRENRIDPDQLRRPEAALEYSAFVRLLGQSAALTGRPDFGLLLADRQRNARVMGPVGVVMENSRTVGQALGYCARHTHAYCLATKVRFAPDRAKHVLLVTLEILLDAIIDTRQAVEHALALAHFNISDITRGAAGARQIQFRHQPLAPLAAYRERFGCEVRFGQAADGLLLTEADLVCEICDPDALVYEMATSFIDQRFPSATPPLHARVRGLVLQRLGTEDCTNARVAAQLCMHPRTLQRRLRQEGQSFESIKDGVRREVALRYLRDGDMPLTLIAEKLGYAETSVLARSCYRWFEASPLQLRRQSASSAKAAAGRG